MRKISFILGIIIFGVSSLGMAADRVLELLERQKGVEIELTTRLQKMEGEFRKAKEVIESLQKEVGAKGLQQLEAKQKELDKQQVDLHNQWIDLKVLVEKALKQNQQLETIIFQELKQATASQALLKERLLQLCEKVEKLERPSPILAWWFKNRFYLAGVFLLLLSIFVARSFIRYKGRKNNKLPDTLGKELSLKEQLNLAKAYLELEEKESGRLILERLAKQDQDLEVQKVALKLLNQLEN